MAMTLTDQLAELRTPAWPTNKVFAAHDPEYLCSRCECMKSGDAWEPNGKYENCTNYGCLCHWDGEDDEAEAGCEYCGSPDVIEIHLSEDFSIFACQDCGLS